MATVPIRPQLHLVCAAAAASKLLLFRPSLRGLCTLAPSLKNRTPSRTGVRARGRAAVLEELRENWLGSLSCPFPIPEVVELGLKERDEGHIGKWVLGIDPDVSGALALLKDADDGDASACSAQVFDTPHLQVLVGKRVRKRLDARSVVQLLHSFGAPLGTTAYIEQSTPFPQDGKQGWYSGGFTYGLWIGILVSSGFSVVPVPSRLWKDQFQLSRNSSSKDDSRKAASDLFPPLSSSLKRKKDHGRAEALLIAAYGKGLRLQSSTIATSTPTQTPTPTLSS